MLRWTHSGAVTTPRTVQIRVEVSYPDRVPAGAPSPARRLEPDELTANIRYFTEALRGPRTQPCSSLVLSGHGVATRADVPAAIRLARQLGVEWVVLHAGPEELSHLDTRWMEGAVDRLVLPIHAKAVLPAVAELARECTARGVSVVFAVDLRARLLPDLVELAATLDRLAPAALVFTWPFPSGGAPAVRAPRPGTWEAPLRRAVEGVTATPTLVRGLPACHLPELADRFRRTTNRWYVDAGHQRADALLFLPDVVRFAKSDACRFCTQDRSCDGFFQPYLDSGHPPLRPV